MQLKSLFLCMFVFVASAAAQSVGSAPGPGMATYLAVGAAVVQTHAEPASQPLATAVPPAQVARLADVEYHGNVKSHIFHGPNCRYYDCKNCVRVFTTRQAAIKAGYRPCKICKP